MNPRSARDEIAAEHNRATLTFDLSQQLAGRMSVTDMKAVPLTERLAHTSCGDDFKSTRRFEGRDQRRDK